MRAAAALLAEGGREAVSTRAIAAAAGVQAPTIYRLFGDMNGLLDAVAGFGFSTYLSEKTAREIMEDPVEDLRRGWDLHVGFGLANPAFYKLMYEDPRPGTEHTAAREAVGILHGLVSRVAEAGRLCVGVEHAVRMIHAAGMGVTLALIGTEAGERDPALSEATRETVLGAITTEAHAASVKRRDTPRSDATRHAVALKAFLLQDVRPFTAAERALLGEWLTRFIDTKP